MWLPENSIHNLAWDACYPLLTKLWLSEAVFTKEQYCPPITQPWLSDNCVREVGDKFLVSVGKTKLLKKNVTSHARDCFQPESDKHFRSKVTAQEVSEFSQGCYSADSQGQATW